MSDLTNIGDGLGMAILGLGAVGLLVMLGLGGLALMKRRVPLAALVVTPVIVCALGALGAWYSASGSLGTISNTDPNMIVEAASQGAFDAIQTDWLSRWVGAFLFGVGAWAAGLGAFMAGPWSRFTPMAAIGSATLTLAGAGVIGAYANQHGIDSTPLIALLLFSGFGVAFSSLRRALYEDSHRVAAMRFASAMCMLLAISYGSRAVVQEVQMNAFGPGGIAVQADSLANAIMMWGEVATPGIAISWIAFGFAVLIALAGFYYELGEVVERITLIDVGITLVLLGSLGLLRTVEDWQLDKLQAIETSAPAAEMYAELTNDLPPGLLDLEDKAVAVRPAAGGFGDVYLWDDEASTWSRSHKWTGTSWEPDTTALASVNDPSQLRPLLVMETGHLLEPTLQVLEKYDNNGLLLMRSEEVKAETVVPPELTHLQVTFLPLVLDANRDLSTQMWSMAGERGARIAAAEWHGYEEDDIQAVYMTAALADTEAPGLQVIVDEKSGVKDVIRSCLPTLFDKLEDEDVAEANEAWCRISGGTRDEASKEAMEAREPAAHERFQARIGSIPPLASRGIGAAHIRARLPYEYAAIDYCLGQAVDEGEELNGPLHMQLTINRKGRISSSLHEKSKNTNDMAARCVRGRMGTIQFEVDKEQWPEAAEGKPNEPQTFDLTFDIKA